MGVEALVAATVGGESVDEGARGGGVSWTGSSAAGGAGGGVSWTGSSAAGSSAAGTRSDPDSAGGSVTARTLAAITPSTTASPGV